MLPYWLMQVPLVVMPPSIACTLWLFSFKVACKVPRLPGAHWSFTLPLLSCVYHSMSLLHLLLASLAGSAHIRMHINFILTAFYVIITDHTTVYGAVCLACIVLLLCACMLAVSGKARWQLASQTGQTKRRNILARSWVMYSSTLWGWQRDVTLTYQPQWYVNWNSIGKNILRIKLMAQARNTTNFLLTCNNMHTHVLYIL